MARKTAAQTDIDDSLAIRAAWLHFVGGLTQSAVAKRLGLPSVKAHRLISKAVADGFVKVTIEGNISECVSLEVALAEKYDLNYCEVTPDLGEEGIPIKALGVAGASFLRRKIEDDLYPIIGLGHGRALEASIKQLPKLVTKDQTFVSLLGGLTRNYSLNPHDVMYRLADKTGAQAYVMPVPFFANSVSDREILLTQRGVSEVYNMANEVDLKFVGIGAVELDAQLVFSGMIGKKDIKSISADGGVGELLGYFFDKDGRMLKTELTARTLGVQLEKPASDTIVAVAGGAVKVKAIRSVLASGFLKGLITDEKTAQTILAEQP